ncbi:UNVERIFIED_CONTAM: contractile injection system tape measure protein [Microbacterium sp. SLM126]
MTDVVVDRIRLRGAGTARLARIAARSLPAALEGALGDVDDAEIDAIAVSIDADVLALDDEAIAAVWADAIRAALIAEGVPTRRGASDAALPGRTAASSGPRSARDAEAVRRRARAWAESSWPRGPVPAGALDLAARASSGTGGGVADLGDDELGARIREALEDELRSRRRHGDAPAGRRSGDTSAPRLPTPAVRPATGSPPRPEAPPPHPDPVEAAAAAEAGHSGALDLLADALADLVRGAGADESVDLDLVTRAAGLALLYPWLADHCRSAVDALPLEPPASVRAAALAALVDPDDPDLVDDVLVRHLAGVREGDPAVSAPRYDTAMMRDAADGVVRSFASLLPGFGASSAPFIRREWLERPGLLDTGCDPALLLAHARPLDVVLDALPYPFGLFALPWCRPVTVRFRP